MAGASDHFEPIVPSYKLDLVRTIYEWAVGSGLTPQLLVSATLEGVIVPMEYVKDGQIILNIHPRSIKDLSFDQGYIWFSARFGGRQMDVTLPVDSVVAIFARENGQGIFFQADGSGFITPSGSDGGGDDESPKTKPELKKTENTKPNKQSDSGPSHLTLVK